MDYLTGPYDAIYESSDFEMPGLPSDYGRYFINPFNLADKKKLSTTGYSENKINIIKAFDATFPFIMPAIQAQENEDSKHVLFKTKMLKKRGRKKSLNDINNSNKPKRKIHCKTDDDNVLIKIQAHFLRFVINITNDILEQYFSAKKNNIYFKQINYDDKKNITIDHISKLKSSSIGDILQKKISPKYRKYDKYYNKSFYIKLLDKINQNESLNWLNDFFNMNYLELFKSYKTYKKSDFFIQGKKINFSKKTKLFCDLLEKNKNDQEIQKCLEEISERYLNGVWQQYKKIFMVSKNK